MLAPGSSKQNFQIHKPDTPRFTDVRVEQINITISSSFSFLSSYQDGTTIEVIDHPERSRQVLCGSGSYGRGCSRCPESHAGFMKRRPVLLFHTAPCVARNLDVPNSVIHTYTGMHHSLIRWRAKPLYVPLHEKNPHLFAGNSSYSRRPIHHFAPPQTTRDHQ